ncbi:DUF4870 domain-containing protein [Alteribacillus iranensis]|uniref:Uncharacterized membrane protein n=1 Tax=Alteribacillus iranensis TaxID=930128 RepID=A0A1I2BU23_9BACI|nr:DUF4870 domain-containing protein [Alteribacillus iranensis]SFE59599.1 Uncharacterized membrane protein [Alteribacillus iranensis]
MDHEEEKTHQSKEEISAATSTESSRTSTAGGLDENVAGLLCYLVGFITGIIFILIEKENRFVRFHALQSIFTFGILFVASTVLTAVPIIGWLLSILLAPLSVIVWVILMVKAYQGRWFKLPVVGDMAEKQLNK